jgi:putative transposase
MILTYKVKHGRDFSEELRKAKQVADFAIVNRSRTSTDVKHIGLKSAISNQILKKYSRDWKAKKAKNVNLTIPSQSIKFNKDDCKIHIPCLHLSLSYEFPNNFEKINQIEIDNNYAFVSVSVPEAKPIESTTFIGIDRNTTGHIVTIANPETGKVWKLGRKAEHVHKKYKHIRKKLQKQGKYRKVKQLKNKESRVVKDLNHKVSTKIIQIALQNNCNIKMENLTGIRNNRKQAKSFRYSLNSWSFYQLQQFVEYKAKLHGVEVVYIEPAYTSQTCSKCGHIGDRNRKSFKCPHCGHVENADINAAFNIATSQRISQLHKDRDLCKGNTDIPKAALV